MFFPILSEGVPFVVGDYPGAGAVSDIPSPEKPGEQVRPSTILFLVFSGLAIGVSAAVFAYFQGLGYWSIFLSYMLGGLSGIGVVALYLCFSGGARSGPVGQPKKNATGCLGVHIPAGAKAAIASDQCCVRPFVARLPADADKSEGGRLGQILIVSLRSASSRRLADWAEEYGWEAGIVAHDRLADCWLLDSVQSASLIACLVLNAENVPRLRISDLFGQLRRIAPDVPIMLVAGRGQKHEIAGWLSRHGITPDTILEWPVESAVFGAVLAATVRPATDRLLA